MSVGSNRQADRTNRIVLSVVGGLAVITGTAGLAFSYASSGATRPFADQSRRDWLLANGTVLAMAGAALIVVLAAWRWPGCATSSSRSNRRGTPP